MLILKDRRLDGEGEGNVVLWAKAGGCWRGGVVGRVLILDSGKDQVTVSVPGEVGRDLVNFDNHGNDEGLNRGALGVIVAGEGIGADQKTIVDGAAARARVKKRRDDRLGRVPMLYPRSGRSGLNDSGRKAGGREVTDKPVGPSVEVAAKRFREMSSSRIRRDTLRRYRQRRKHQGARYKDTCQNSTVRSTHGNPSLRKICVRRFSSVGGKALQVTNSRPER